MNPNDPHREDLSALIDGALDADRARFLLRRLQHDEALAADLGRWQLAGDVLRGQAVAPAPTGFAEAVAARIAGEPVPVLEVGAPVPATPSDGLSAQAPKRASAGHGARWRWFGGGAMAASLAIISLLALRPLPPAGAQADAAPVAMATARSTVAPVAAAPTPVAVPVQVVAAAPVPATVASTRIASPPVRIERRADTRPGRSMRIARASGADAVARVPVSRQAGASPVQAAAGPRLALDVADAAPGSASVAAPRDPFQPPAARAWPRATVPGAGSGTFNARLERSAAYYPFAPRTDASAGGE